jgi:hypothetical protein
MTLLPNRYLFDAHGDAVEEALAWPLVRILAVACCTLCERKVLDVREFAADDPDEPAAYLRLCPVGPIVMGTYHEPGYVRVAKASGGKLGGRLPSEGHWYAALNLVSTPTLPTWCNRDGAGTVLTAHLRAAASGAAHNRNAPPKMVRSIHEAPLKS